MRTVAILDYWSQSQLRPIHQVLADILRRLPQDCTFDQSRFVSALARGTTPGFPVSEFLTDRDFGVLPVLDDQDVLPPRPPFPRFNRFIGSDTYYSVDLTAATDRFPLLLQE